jgi:hypothetical protein
MVDRYNSFGRMFCLLLQGDGDICWQQVPPKALCLFNTLRNNHNILPYIYVLLYILCVLCFCIAVCIVSPHVYSYLLSCCVQLYRTLPPGGNPTGVNKYHITYLFSFQSYWPQPIRLTSNLFFFNLIPHISSHSYSIKASSPTVEVFRRQVPFPVPRIKRKKDNLYF